MEFLRELLSLQYGKKLAEEIYAGYSVRRAVTLRTNLLKAENEEIEKSLEEYDIAYNKMQWCKEAFVINEIDDLKVRELNIYKQGQIYLQSLSSMLPPIILSPKPHEDILDMTAAPGGKTTQLASMSHGKAHITACERNKIRAEKLKYNLQKQGAGCVSVMIQDARQLDDFLSFDKLLLDAPCSGSGTLNLYDSKQINAFTEDLVTKSSSLQFSLLKKAVKLIKRGGELVYSTCSVLECENEANVQKILPFGMEVVPIEFDGMKSIPQLPCKVNGALCVKPTELYEGFFVCKMVKR